MFLDEPVARTESREGSAERRGKLNVMYRQKNFKIITYTQIISHI